MKNFYLIRKLFLLGCFILNSNNVVFAEELYGIFMIVKGTVEVESAKTGKAVVKVGAKVYPGDQVISQKDSRAKIVMSDRNVINISPETKLIINKYENDAKTGTKNVELELTQGKVRNNVEQKYDGEKSKFLIKTPTAVAGVRGTQFLTTFDPKTRLTEVVTFKGAVQMAPILANGQVSSQSVTIKKNEKSSLKAGQEAPEPPKAMPKEDMKKADSESQVKNKNDDSKSKKDVQSENTNDKRAPNAENDSKDSKQPMDMVGPGNIEANMPPPIEPPPPPPPPVRPSTGLCCKPPAAPPIDLTKKLKTTVIIKPVTPNK